MDFKKVAHSQTVLTELMIPSYANFGGKVHGGTILSLMDKVAYVCASKHTASYCVTASISGVYFRAPVEVGDLVSLYASVNYVGTTSLMVGIKVITENLKLRTVKHTNTSYFTFVCMDDEGNKKGVPGLILENEDEVRRFVEGKLRKEYNFKNNSEFERVKEVCDNEERIQMLKAENCKVL